MSNNKILREACFKNKVSCIERYLAEAMFNRHATYQKKDYSKYLVLLRIYYIFYIRKATPDLASKA